MIGDITRRVMHKPGSFPRDRGSLESPVRQFVPVTLAVLVSLCGGCGNPSAHGHKDWKEYRKAEAEARQKQAQPVIDALEKSRLAHGKYPEALNELVAGKFLDVLPDLASRLDHQGQSGRIEGAEPLGYERVGTGYRLTVEFRFVEKAGHQMEWGTSDEFFSEYRPDRNVWGPRRMSDAKR